MSSTAPIPGPIGVVDAMDYRRTDSHPEYRELIKAVQSVNSTSAQTIFGENCRLKFRVDADTRRPVIEIVDGSSNAVLFQIPPESVIRMAGLSRSESSSAAAAYYEPSGGQDGDKGFPP